MANVRFKKFLEIKRCTGCGWTVKWKEEFRACFPRSWKGTCPHCGAELATK